ncbi:MAG: cyclic nucleotide-binding domain-containing protein, partial [gamma proteobacterium symbiont of Taylorina sp.]|nr:cyclic nucleotide-binding domain-containing protein [gamma proteobacterium symbiont of Taylorina sp.]
MAAVPKVDINIVRQFQPFDSLNIEKVKEIIEKSAVQKLPVGRTLFSQGDKDKWVIYLLSGTIELKQADGNIILIEAGTDSAKHAVSNIIPRLASAQTKTEISILIIDRDLLDLLLNWNNSSSIEVSDLNEDDEDWMTRFLQSNAFLQLPPANIQALMMRLHEEPLTQGDVIIKENSLTDDKFYIIQQGICIVTKTNPVNEKEVTLAHLHQGDSFGEEALITGGFRGASVTMQTDGVILTLDKKDFIELLVSPLIHRIKMKNLDNLLLDEQYELIDVRNENEYAANKLNNAQYNIPVNLIRSQLETLNIEKHYIIYSNHENRSSAGAFLFIQQGYECSILEEGLGKLELSLDDQIFDNISEKQSVIEQSKPIHKNQSENSLENLTQSSSQAGSQQNLSTSSDSKSSGDNEKALAEQLLLAETAYKESKEKTRQHHEIELQNKSKEITEALNKEKFQTELTNKAIKEAAQFHEAANKVLHKLEHQEKLFIQTEAELVKARQETQQLRKDSNAHQQAVINEAHDKSQLDKQHAEKIETERKAALEEVEYLKHEMKVTHESLSQEFDQLNKKQEISLQEKITSLQEKTEQFKQQDRLNKQIQQDDQLEIQRLNKELAVTQQALVNTDEQKKSIENSRKDLETEIQKLSTESLEHHQKIGNENQSLAKELQQNDEEKQSLAKNLQIQDEDNQSLIKELQQKDEDNQSLTKELQQRDEDNQSLTKELQQRDEDNQSLTKDLQQKDEDNQSLTKDLQQKDEDNQSLTKDLQQKDED